MSAPASGITAALHRAWIQQLRLAWQRVNVERLSGRLRPPTFRIDTATQRLGSWHDATRTLTLSEHHVLNDPWRDVVATLRHEMAHQVVHELLGGASRPHGERFREACALLDIDPSGDPRAPQADAAAGDPAGDTAGGAGDPGSAARTRPPAAAKALSRVRKLLALAESDNRNEAEAAMAQAHRLLLTHNLSHPVDPARPDYTAQVVGRPTAAIPLAWKLVGGILEAFFFVECVWTTTYNPRRDRLERELELLGRRHDVEMASWVHDFLHAEVDRLWRGARERGLAKGQRVKREYVAGVLLGFRDKLKAERTACKARGLVWVGDADLQAFTRRRFPRLRALSGAGVRRTGAHEAGRQAGASLTLRRPVASQGQRGRRLPGPKG